MEDSSEIAIKELKEASAVQEFPSESERKEIVSQLQELTQEVERIDKSYRAGALESWIEPAGAEGRSWDEEMEYALAHRHEGYIPQLTYPALERGFLDPEKPEETKLDIEGGLNEITGLQGQIPSPLLEKKAREYRFLEAVKNRDHEGVIANMPHDLPSAQLVAEAQRAYDEDLKPKPEKSAVAQKLDANKFNSSEIAEYFEYGLSLLGAEGWRVEIVQEGSSIKVLPDTRTILIPHTRTVGGTKLLSLIAHEEGAHVATAQKAINAGFGTAAMGAEAETVQEGIAKLAENDVEEMVAGFVDPPNPYYVLGIQKAVETKGDFWQTFDYLVELRKRELAAQGRSEKYIEKNANKTPLTTVRRIFRGAVELSRGGYVYSKDKAYLEGEVIARKVKEAGLLGYLLAGKYDIPTAVYLLRTGIIPKDAVGLTIDVAQRIFENRGDRDYLENLNWYRENYNPPYWREYGLTDEEYERLWREKMGKS